MPALRERLIAAIRADGPMTVAAYMQACLADRDSGYYTTREPFGVAGDFVTAPEISQMFGELIGAWAVETWQRLGAPDPFALVELGPGRGTLMADLLRVARLRPAFLKAARLHLVETSPRLRAAQEAALKPSGIAVGWGERFAEVPTLPAIVIANEFFDALPIRQFVRVAAGWAERMVGLDEAGELSFGLRAAAGPDRAAPLGAVSEVGEPGRAMMAEIAARIAGEGGAALVVDYGYAGPAHGDTLQAVSRHRPVDPLALPGESDLTAHVDFSALAEAARGAGAAVRGPVEQGAFLAALGLAARARQLAEGKDAATRAAIAAAAERLAGAGAMGRLFKVLGIARPGIALPGFD